MSILKSSLNRALNFHLHSLNLWCKNLWGLSRERIYRMIKETEMYYPALLKAVKATPEYNNAAWFLQYQMESILDIYKRALHTFLGISM